MFRRDFLKTSALLGFGTTVPGFLARTARAAEVGKDTVLVVVELTGGNDGLNTVIPYADDRYHKARPTLRYTKDKVIRLDDHVGLHPGLNGLKPMLDAGQVTVVQGVGYPNPDRSHFESMDVWQTADPKRATPTGWLGRAAANAKNATGGIPVLHIGPGKLPLAVLGAGGSGAVSVGDQTSFKLEVGQGEAQTARRKLVEDLSAGGSGDDLDAFVRRRQLQTLTAVETLRDLLEGPNAVRGYGAGLNQKLQLIAGLIARGFGTRIFYVSLDGFDTHADQLASHQQLMVQLGDAVGTFFNRLKETKHDDRVRLMTFSEFGRRVHENGSRGTDHGAGSCLFVAGPSVKGGVVGKHPSLADLDSGDLQHHTDFRRVYASLLDGWLGCDSKAVLGSNWEPMKELAARA